MVQTRGVNLPDPMHATPAMRLIAPLVRFLEIESASGVVLILCTIVALVAANSPWAAAWDALWHTKASISVGSWVISSSLAHWVNDGLMTVFFFVVGLEIKRELVDGELRSLRQAALPLVGALGGMVVPAAIYLLLQGRGEGQRGWGIPMATDIAFAVGVLALLGNRVPIGLKIFLLALAIADDIGAILVIALFYSSDLSPLALALAGLGLAVVAGMNRLGVRSIGIYTFIGVGIWLAMFQSGIHPTVAGVVLGLMTPGRAWVPGESLVELLLRAVDRLEGRTEPSHSHDHHRLMGKLTKVARETISPLERLEFVLHPWVAFGIMPIFALANAGVPIQTRAAGSGIALAVAAGLLVGKPLGIGLLSWMVVRLGWASLPTGVNWASLLGAGCLGGIGFTMSLFIASLALKDTNLDAAKIGTLSGSLISGTLGLIVLYLVLPRRPQSPPESPSETSV
ncbi:MAG TPA: Na+/H+ antiporter NhaA [Pirellulaceae bacterium]|nr:Na+/H+ antiporter NhaA [Pirellulaceae bacterium]